MHWTQRHVKTLTALWQKGLSASQIAAQMGDGVTRNAVIGKIHRLGLNARRISDPKIVQLRVGSEHTEALAEGGKALLMDQLDDKLNPDDCEQAQGCCDSIVSLSRHSCRWPIGEPGAPGFRFCGARKVNGLSYCAVHMRRAYQPARRKRKAAQGAKQAGGSRALS